MSKFKNKIDEVIRVNYAGEYGAKRIYEGQEMFMCDSNAKKQISEMKEHELEHLQYFENKLKENSVRPSLFMPLWHGMGFALGAATALMGKKTAMACTIAVEEVIVEHYQEQLDSLPESEKELKKKIKKFQNDEEHHKDIGVDNEGLDAPFYRILSNVIKIGSKSAIFLSKKI